MKQAIHNFDKDLVKIISEAIFKQEITSIKKLKDIAFEKGFEEDDVPDILQVFLDENMIVLPAIKIDEKDFMVNKYKISELEKEGLI